MNTWSELLKKIYTSNFNINKSKLFGVNSEPLFDAKITIIQILLTMKKCKENESPWANGISSEFLKNLPEN